MLALVLASCGGDEPTGVAPNSTAVAVARSTTVHGRAAGEDDTVPGSDEPVADPPSPPPTQSEPVNWQKVSPDVVAVLAADGQVQVLVSLDADADPGRIAAVREEVLDRIGDAGFRVRVEFDGVPAIAGLVLSTDALVALERDPGVVAVAVDTGGGGD